MTEIRTAGLSDLPALVELYNDYVINTAITFDVDPYTIESRRPWFDQFADIGRHRLIVAVDGKRLLGYACSMPFRPKKAYETSVETSIYLARSAAGKGLGSLLYNRLLAAIGDEDIHRAYGIVTLPNPASEALHKKAGFAEAAILREVGRKFGKYWDVKWYERAF